MKISKTLLSAVMAGITVHAVSSCKKETDKSFFEKIKQEIEKKSKEKTSVPFPCPACGMG